MLRPAGSRFRRRSTLDLEAIVDIRPSIVNSESNQSNIARPQVSESIPALWPMHIGLTFREDCSGLLWEPSART